jgi:hypothetical protein
MTAADALKNRSPAFPKAGVVQQEETLNAPTPAEPLDDPVSTSSIGLVMGSPFPKTSMVRPEEIPKVQREDVAPVDDL